MTKLFLILFYFILFALTIVKSRIFISNDLSNKYLDFKNFSFILNYTDLTPLLMPALFALLSVTFILYLILNFNKFINFLLILLFLITLSALYPYGHISHQYHLWMYTLILILFLKPNETLSSERNIKIIRLSQGLILSIYFLAGFWKTKNIISELYQLDSISLIGLNHIAASAAEGISTNKYIFSIYTTFPLIINLGFFLVIIFQISCLIPIFKMKYFKIYGVLSLCFHLTTLFSLNTAYYPQLVISFLMLFIVEKMIAIENQFK